MLWIVATMADHLEPVVLSWKGKKNFKSVKAFYWSVLKCCKSGIGWVNNIIHGLSTNALKSTNCIYLAVTIIGITVMTYFSCR